jgi:hypothetical protein
LSCNGKSIPTKHPASFQSTSHLLDP